MIKVKTYLPPLNFGLIVMAILGVVAFAGIADLGFNLALGNLGCRVLWGLLGPYCGQKTGMAMALCLFVTPLAAYFAIKRPWLFPVSLYAFLVPSDSYLNLTSAGSVTKLAGILATGAVVLYLMRNRRFNRPSPATLVWLAYFGYSSLTLFWAYNIQDTTIQIWATFFQLVLFYFIISSAEISEDDFRILVFFFVVGCMAASLFGAYVFSHGQTHHIVNQGRLKAKFGEGNAVDSDLFSASLVFPIAIVIMNALRSRWGIKKLAYIGSLGVLLVGQFVVGARGGFVADGVVMLYFFWRNRYRAQLVAVGVTAFLLSLVYPNALWARFFAPEKSAGGSGRAEIWKVGFAALKHYWLLGAGFSNFPDVYDRYYLKVWNAFATSWHRGPHNIVLEAWVETGIVGVSLLLLGWWKTFHSLRHIPKLSRLYDFRIALEGGTLGAFVVGVTVGLMQYKFIWWQFALVALWRSVTLRQTSIDQSYAAGKPLTSMDLHRPESTSSDQDRDLELVR